MKIQIVVPPALYQTSMHMNVPYGAAYIASALIEEGREVRIENGDLHSFSDQELLSRIRAFSPDIVGFSATVATSYKYIKRISARIKQEFPSVKIIVGGGLSAAAETVLNNTATDIVVIGEGDITVKELARRVSAKEPYGDVAGIAFKEADRMCITAARKSIMDLDVLKYPAYDLIDMQSYLFDVRSYVTGFSNYKRPDSRLFAPGRSRRMLRFPISRGCISRCSFCYRSVLGLRHFSFRYIFDYVEYLMKKFDINVLSFGDECFAPTKAWVWKFLEELNRRGLDIMFQVFGAKVETVDREILMALKQAGCFAIEYGFESGSQRMLDIMEKRVTIAQNIAAAVHTREAGIFTMPAIVLGMPGETTESVLETIAFLKKIGYGPKWYQYTHAFAMPGTPLYEYALATGLIADQDKYLESIYTARPNDYGASPNFINFTSESTKTVKGWPAMILESLLKYYSRNKLDYLIKKYVKPGSILFYLKERGVGGTILKTLRQLLPVKKTGAIGYSVTGIENIDRQKHLEVIGNYLKSGGRGISLRNILAGLRGKETVAYADKKADAVL